jgi:hypothetical protein
MVKNIKLKGSAMILTMFILAGILIVAMSGSYVVLVGITAGGTQAQSTKAYFAAESGVEFILWDLRKNFNNHGASQQSTTVPLVSGSLATPSLSYEVFFTYVHPRTYISVGSFQSAKRSVEVSL